MSSRVRTRLGRRSPQEADFEQIEAIYRRSVTRLRRVAAAIIGDRDAALDAVQTGFSTAVRRRADFSGDGPLDAWAWRIVVNEARDVRARLLAHDAAGPRGEILAALAALSERQRLVVFLRYYADFDNPSIARVLAINERTVGATLDQAHPLLQELLEKVSP
jgi:RNA polymerase sigma-70 factor (ECF subfamily)